MSLVSRIALFLLLIANPHFSDKHINNENSINVNKIIMLLSYLWVQRKVCYTEVSVHCLSSKIHTQKQNDLQNLLLEKSNSK